MKDKVNQDSINNALWAACDSFRGVVTADTYKDYILTMLFLKYISDAWQDRYESHQVEHGDKPELIEKLMERERFVLPKAARFHVLYELRHEPGNGERIDQALRAIEEVNGTKLQDSGRSVFQEVSFNSDRLGEEKQKNVILRHLLESFAKPELNLKPSRFGTLNVVANAYEYLLKNFAASNEQKGADFYTPPEVSDLMAELVDPKPGDRICDPFCGSASLLMKCASKVRKNHGSNHYALYGQEATGSTWSLAKMNMFLNGEDKHRIEWGDTIRNPKLLDKNGHLMLFDVVIANPPFSLEKWGRAEAKLDKFGRFLRGIPPKTKGVYAIILHMIETLEPGSHFKKGGRMAVIVPHGVLFRGAAEGRIRKQLIEGNLLDTVIGLPEKLFYGTGIPAAILLFSKEKNDSNVLFIDASREFEPGKNQNLLTEGNIRKIINTYRQVRNPDLVEIEVRPPIHGVENFSPAQPGVVVDKYAYLASLDEILENDYNLNISRYVDTFEEEEEVNLMEMRDERERLKVELVGLEAEMAKYLREYGYGG